jgi:hypothetical protein
VWLAFNVHISVSADWYCSNYCSSTCGGSATGAALAATVLLLYFIKPNCNYKVVCSVRILLTPLLLLLLHCLLLQLLLLYTNRSAALLVSCGYA